VTRCESPNFLSGRPPGFEIINSLDATDSRSLGLHEVDLGGPASSVPCVAMTASIDEFNQMMQVRALPSAGLRNAATRQPRNLERLVLRRFAARGGNDKDKG
jgi:hypothetical protein